MLIVVPGLSISFLMFFFTILPIVYSLFVSVISVLPAITLCCLCFVGYTLPVWRINLFSQKRMYALTLTIRPTTNIRMCNVT